MNAVIYLRVSTKEQAAKDETAEGYSIPAQREACVRYVAERGWNVAGEYVDAGESARTADRPMLKAMLRQVAEGEIGAIEGEPTMVDAGGDLAFAFRILDRTGQPITSFDELHDRRMHLIVVRRDLTGFQHLHPAMDQDGTWRTNLALPTGGAWRAFADFATGGRPMTLGVDVLVEGDFRPEALPRPTTTVEAMGDVVSLDVAAGGGLHRFAVTRDGEPVQVEPYLGARGHLVALRWGDLAFLHVHPVADDGHDIAFAVTYPSAGVYRLFLQYSVGGEVRTVAFTTASE